METAARHLEDERTARASALLIAMTLAEEVAESTRRYGLDERLLRVANECDKVVALCRSALSSGG